MMIWWSALGNSKCLLPKSYKKKVWHYHCNALVAITIKNRWVKVKVDRISLLNWIKNYFAILLWVSNWFCKEQIMIISFLVLRASWLWNASIQHDATEWRPWILSEKNMELFLWNVSISVQNLGREEDAQPTSLCSMHYVQNDTSEQRPSFESSQKSSQSSWPHSCQVSQFLRAGVKDICVLLS